MYVSLTSNDVSIRGFNVYKAWDFTEANASGSGIKVLSGSYVSYRTKYENDQDTKNFDGTSQRLLYNLVNHLYYKTGSGDELTIYRPENPMIEYSKIPYFRGKLDSNIKVITIPQQIYGEKILPGSVKLSLISGSTVYNLIDDTYCNLYDISDSASFASYSIPQVGNVFYDSGIIVITSTGSYPDSNTGSYVDSVFDYTLEFSGSHTIYELEVVCNVKENELNYTQNPTALISGSATFIPLLSHSGSFIGTSSYGESPITMSYADLDARPFITTIGLYNDTDDLIAVGKFARPIQKENYLDMGFIVKIDL